MSSNWLGNYENPERPVYHPPATITTPLPPEARGALEERPDLMRPKVRPFRGGEEMWRSNRDDGHRIRELLQRELGKEKIRQQLKQPTPATPRYAPNLDLLDADQKTQSVLRPK